MYFVMKYVSGRPLDSVIQEVGRLSIPMVQTILAHVGDALGYAHRHGVIHRDIKSANIMLDEEGWAVVTDFGIAKVVQAEGLTMTGVTVGTPSYMSPEQCANLELTGASDQYSLGVVAYEMLTGQLPFGSDSSMTVMYAHFNEQPRPVTDLRPDCPANLAAAVMRMLDKDPRARWPSMDDVVAVCGRPSLRHDDPIRRQMIALALERTRLLTEIKTPTSPLALTKPLTRRAVPQARRVSRLWWGLGVVGVAAIAGALWWAAPWQRVTRPPPSAGDTIVVSQPPAAPLVAEPAAARPAPAPRRSAPLTPPSGRAAADTVARVAAAPRADSLLLSLRATALAAMRRALEAGATPAELTRGDTALRGAESLAAAGRSPEAMVQLVTATSLWNEAERLARARAVAAAVTPPTPVPPADPRPQIEAVIADYARALESRDLDQVHRTYPGLTAAQQQGWQDLFRSIRALKASLSVTTLSVAGGTAEATVSGVYEYENATTGRTDRRPVTFRASLVADSAGWRLSAIR
jgi:hypothetical protein